MYAIAFMYSKMKKYAILLLTVFMTGCHVIPAHEKMNASVVVIGMENSAFAGPCPGAHVDATRMANEFRARYFDVVLLEDASATKDAAIAALSNAAKSDFMILFYSGHGGSQRFRDTGSEEVDGRDEFLCLYDGYLRDNEIWNIISGCKGRVWLIFDCCHSETMFRSVGFKMQMVNGMVLPLASSMSMLCWSGCADDTFSYGDASGGMFTDAFFRNLNTKFTYDQLWTTMSKDEKLKTYEIIKQTKLGNAFDNVKVFK